MSPRPFCLLSLVIGTYKYDLRLYSQTGISEIQNHHHPDAVGQRRFMKKGEKIYLETVMSSWWSHSRVNVGVIYHGKTEGGGTWLDGVQKAHFNGRAQVGFQVCWSDQSENAPLKSLKVCL